MIEEEAESAQNDEATTEAAAAASQVTADAKSTAFVANMNTAPCPCCGAPRMPYAYFDWNGKVVLWCLDCTEKKHFDGLQQL